MFQEHRNIIKCWTFHDIMVQRHSHFKLLPFRKVKISVGKLETYKWRIKILRGILVLAFTGNNPFFRGADS